MLKAGSIVGDALEANSMALAIEQAMIAQGVLKPDEESPEAAESRRKAFVAIATGIVNHLLDNLEVVIGINKLGTVPVAETKLLASSGEIR